MKERWYLDFDGTLTGLAGETVVTSAAYELLFTEDSRSKHHKYSEAIFIPEDQMVDLLTKQIKTNPHIGLTKGAKEFILEKIKAGDDLVFVSKNRKEYITAVLLAQGLTHEELKNITIYGTKELTDCKAKVSQHKTCGPLQEAARKAAIDNQGKADKCAPIIWHEYTSVPFETTEIVECIYLCDDNQKDLRGMKAAAEEMFDLDSKIKIIPYSEETGQFPWSKWLPKPGVRPLSADQASEADTAPTPPPRLFSPGKASSSADQASEADTAPIPPPRLFSPGKASSSADQASEADTAPIPPPRLFSPGKASSAEAAPPPGQPSDQIPRVRPTPLPKPTRLNPSSTTASTASTVVSPKFFEPAQAATASPAPPTNADYKHFAFHPSSSLPNTVSYKEIFKNRKDAEACLQKLLPMLKDSFPHFDFEKALHIDHNEPKQRYMIRLTKTDVTPKPLNKPSNEPTARTTK